MKIPRVVLFDLGNVLVQFRPERFWAILGETDTARQLRIGAEMKAMGRGYESGEMTTEEFRSALIRIAGSGHSPEAIDRAFLGVLPEPVPGMEAVIRSTAQKASIALVSNTSPLHFEFCLRTIPSLRHIQRFYLSYHLRALKPDAAFYQAVIAGEQCEPGEMVFIDDLSENIDGARRAGMQGIVFENADKLAAELRMMGF